MADDKKAGAKPSAPAKQASKKSSGPKPYVALRACPKCGPGVHLANHQGRMSCGKCGYTEFSKQ